MMEPLKPGDRVVSDDSHQWPGTVLQVGLGPFRDAASVQLDPNPEFPPAMSLKVGGLERNWLRVMGAGSSPSQL